MNGFCVNLSVCTPQSHAGEWRYSSTHTHSDPRHYLNVVVSFPLSSRVFLIAGLNLFKTEECIALPRNRTTSPLSSIPYPSICTDLAVPAVGCCSNCAEFCTLFFMKVESQECFVTNMKTDGVRLRCIQYGNFERIFMFTLFRRVRQIANIDY